MTSSRARGPTLIKPVWSCRNILKLEKWGETYDRQKPAIRNKQLEKNSEKK